MSELRSFSARIALFGLSMGFLVLVGVGCASRSTPPVTGDEPVFPPHQLRPVSVAVLSPIQDFDLGPVHESLGTFSGSPARRRQLMECVWVDGVSTLAKLAVPGTEMNSFVFGRSPFQATGSWVSTKIDTLGKVSFSLTGMAALDLARHQGISYLVLPAALKYEPAGQDSSSILLSCDLAIVDITERAIVWQGSVGFCAEGQVGLFRTGVDQPRLTDFEIATYGWVLELCSVFDRIKVKPETGLGILGLGCHEPVPVLGEQ